MRATSISVGKGLFLLLLLGACAEPNSSTQQISGEKESNKEIGPTVYEVQVEQEKICSLGRVLVNGFPVDKWGGRATHQKYDFSVNTALTGEGNLLTVENEPCFSGGKEALSIGPIQMRVRVKGPRDKWVGGSHITDAEMDSAYEAWSERARDQWAIYQSKFQEGALDSLRAWASRNPMTASTTFDNESGPDFSRVFEEAPRLEDTPATRRRLKDYAMRLRGLMAEKDTSALFEEFRFYYAQQYKVTGYPGSVEEDKASLLESVVMEDPDLDFGRQEVDLRSWSDGRVWEVHRDGEAFFRSGATIQEIYVAELDGRLRVVR